MEKPCCLLICSLSLREGSLTAAFQNGTGKEAPTDDSVYKNRAEQVEPRAKRRAGAAGLGRWLLTGLVLKMFKDETVGMAAQLNAAELHASYGCVL